VDDLQLAAVEAAVRIEDVPEATVLAREGDPSDTVFFLLSGQVSVRLGVHGDQTRRLAAFGAGAAVGEMALLDDSVRSANLVTDEPTRVAVLDVAVLDALELRHPGLKATMYANLAHSLSWRLRRANAQIRALEE
jgi:CRP-like cAMP-binding protein